MIFVNYRWLRLLCLVSSSFSSSSSSSTATESRKAGRNESNRNSQLSIFQPSSPFPGKIFLPGRSIDVHVLTRENLSRALTWPCSRQISTSFFCQWELPVSRNLLETIVLATFYGISAGHRIASDLSNGKFLFYRAINDF